MDEPGFHARRRAEKEDREARRQAKLGSHSAGQPTTKPLVDGEGEDPEQLEFYHAHHEPGQHLEETEGGSIAPAGENEAPCDIDNPPPQRPVLLAPLKSDWKGAPGGKHRRKMEPRLEVMLGPILRYDTVVNNVWHGFAMVVTSDNGSDYSTVPTIGVEWDATHGAALDSEFAEKLNITDHRHSDSDLVHSFTRQAERIHTYHSRDGAQAFWRFKLEVPLAEVEQECFYSVNGGPEHSFWVPAMGQNMNWIGHSCNGFSSGVDPKPFNGPDPLWRDVLRKHEAKPIHVQLGGGDQLYCDTLLHEPELRDWVDESDMKKKAAMPLTEEIESALHRYYFNKYCSWFRSGAFGLAMSRIPLLAQCDDHDIIDGFGSYDDDTQTAPIFAAIGAAGLFWFLLFQCQIADAFDGLGHAPGAHSSKGLIVGGPGAYVQQPAHSFMAYLGPKVYVLLLDARTERKLDQVASKVSYERCFAALRSLPDEVEHVVLLLTVPLAYPRMVGVETLLESKLNPLNLLAKVGVNPVPGYTQKFDGTPELLDDLNDHWCAKRHKPERNWLVEETQKLMLEKRLRISYLSGDVHCAAVSIFHHSKKELEPAMDPKYQVQIVSSAIVNTPPPKAVLVAIRTLGRKKHKTLHNIETNETLVPLFAFDTDGLTKHSLRTVMGRRNFVAGSFDESTGDLVFSIQVEKSQGSGTTTPYTFTAPPPRWA